MRVLLYATQRDIAQLITDQLTEKNHVCFSTKTFALAKELIENHTYKPEIFILDYLSFNHYFYDIYYHFEKHKYNIPIVFFNEPCLVRSTRSEHWLAQIELKQNHYLKLDLETLRPTLLDLEQIIESPKNKPFISLLATPEPLTQNFFNESIVDNIYDFKSKINLRPSLFYLLKILYDKKSEPTTMDEILSIYKQQGKQMSIESLKVLMSELRGKIRKSSDCGLLIYSNNKTFRLVKYK